MAKFSDLTEYFDPGLTLTVQGKEYTVPLPSAELGLWCRTMMTTGQLDEGATDEQLQAAAGQIAELPPLPGNKTVPEHLLGDVYQQMMTDGVPDPYINFCAQTVLFWIIGGEETAERFWRAGGRPERMARGNRAERRAAQKTSTAAASGTKPQGSTSGTSTPKRSNGSGRARRSRGRRS